MLIHRISVRKSLIAFLLKIYIYIKLFSRTERVNMMSLAVQHNRNVFSKYILKDVFSAYFKLIDWPRDKFSVMDIGCGSGKILSEVLLHLLPDNYSEIVAIDVEHSMIEYCQSNNKNPRISFHELDIGTTTLRKSYWNRFDFLVSTFCLHYPRNFRQVLTNCDIMLKPKGQLLFIFECKKHTLYDVYREMAKMDVWKPYLREYENFVPLFSGNNPDAEVRTIFEDCGLEILKCDFKDVDFQASVNQFIRLFQSMDRIYSSIPEDSKDRYKEDFRRVFIANNLNEEEKRKYNVIVRVPSVIVYARKNRLRPLYFIT